MLDFILAIAIFVAVIALLSVIRSKLGATFEIKNTDILIALIPIALFFVLTGKIKTFEFGDFRIEAAFVEASQAAVAPQITAVELPVEPLEMDPKRGVEMIPDLIRKKTQALTFQLGYGYYYGPAIEEYLDRLIQFPFFKYIIILQRDGTFAGLADARLVHSLYSSDRSRYEQFAHWLNNANATALAQLPGYIPKENAIHHDADKQSALEQMEKLNTEMLPAMDSENKFAGVIERGRLISSMMIEVAQKLK